VRTCSGVVRSPSSVCLIPRASNTRQYALINAQAILMVSVSLPIYLCPDCMTQVYGPSKPCSCSAAPILYNGLITITRRRPLFYVRDNLQLCGLAARGASAPRAPCSIECEFLHRRLAVQVNALGAQPSLCRMFLNWSFCSGKP